MINVRPVGHKIIVRRKNEEVKRSGIILSSGNETSGNCWGEIISLPIVSDNMWIKTMKVGDEVMYKRYSADKGISSDNPDEDFEVVDVENNEGTRAGHRATSSKHWGGKGKRVERNQ